MQKLVHVCSEENPYSLTSPIHWSDWAHPDAVPYVPGTSPFEPPGDHSDEVFCPWCQLSFANAKEEL